jgi:hypothetical protein
MPYVRRDGSGRIVAMSVAPLEGFEPVLADDAGLAEFELRADGALARLRESDMEVVRVLDDLIALLIEKNAIRFTDLPEPAQRKLMERRGLRERGAHLGLLGDDAPLL